MFWVAPVSTTVEAASVAPTSAVSIVQPAGPVAVAETVTSWAVSFLSCRSNLNSLSEAPVSSGVLVVRVSVPAASAFTRMLTGSVSSAPPPRAWTRIVDVPAAASAGTVTSSRTSPVPPADTATASTTNPPPSRLAVQPLGTPANDRSMSARRTELTSRSKLTLLPGATTTPGNGVVTSRPSAAPAIGANVAMPSDEMTSAAMMGARRATLVRKVSLLGIERWSVWTADESAKVGRDDTTTYQFTVDVDY